MYSYSTFEYTFIFVLINGVNKWLHEIFNYTHLCCCVIEKITA
jgi:hypothetical protein